MSYNIYVTRKDNWCDEPTKATAITKTEFRKLVQASSNARIDTSSQRSEGMDAILEIDATEISFCLRRGVIQSNVSIVPRELVELFFDFAKKLNAKVVGEENQRINRKELKDIQTVSELNQQEKQDSQLYFELVAKQKQKAEQRTLVLRIMAVVVLLFSKLGILLIPILLIRWRYHDKNDGHL